MKYASLYLLLALITAWLTSATAHASTAIVCSANLGSNFSQCPQDKKNHALSFFDIPTYVACDSSEMFCIGEGYPYSDYSKYYTFFDIDNDETFKYKITIRPMVYGPQGQILKRGKKSIIAVTPSSVELDITDAFIDSYHYKNEIIRMLNVTQQSNGAFVDGTGSASSFYAFSDLSCRTALDYVADPLNTCPGDMNKDIDFGVQSDANFHAFTSAMSKLESVVSAFSPLDIQLSELSELSKFPVVLNYADGSRLVINVEVKDGVVSITLNEAGSRTSSNETFTDYFNNGVSHSTTFNEALLIANSSTGIAPCRPLTFPTAGETIVRKVTTTMPDGSERIIYIYKFQARYVTVTLC